MKCSMALSSQGGRVIATPAINPPSVAATERVRYLGAPMHPLQRATPEEQLVEVTRGSVDVHTAAELQERLAKSYREKAPLLVKAGFDPNRPDLHLGHTLVLTRMRRFQEFGHEVVFVIGDFTGHDRRPVGEERDPPADDAGRSGRQRQDL
jgi:tRNA synthetase class I (W and Y)